MGLKAEVIKREREREREREARDVVVIDWPPL